MKFNINDWIKVKLTPLGRRVLEQDGLTVKVDNEGKTSFQFWIFMNTFRDYWHVTAPAVIEGTIEIESIHEDQTTEQTNNYATGFKDGLDYCKQRIDELIKQHTREGIQ